MINEILLLAILIALAVLGYVLYTRIIQFKLDEKKNEFKLDTRKTIDKIVEAPIEKVGELIFQTNTENHNFLYIDEYGAIHLGAGKQKKIKNVNWFELKINNTTIDKEFNSKNMTSVMHDSFGIEELYIFSKYNPGNILLKAEEEKNSEILKESKLKYDTARLNLGRGILHSAILAIDGEVLKLLVFIAIGAFGIGSMFGLYFGVRFL